MKNNCLIQFDILVEKIPNLRRLFFENETNFGLNYDRKQLKLKNSFQNSFKSCKISTFNFGFLGSVILHQLSRAGLGPENQNHSKYH